ncbi:MAG TPA: hypothetical protein VM143_17920 [Acidimicrobiales bacterium]|nr:hypothetical protein [Acidimicrobiales bacterium]
MAAATVAPRATSAPDWSRKYPPLLALGVAAMLILAVLPNSLNLPQTNPTQTLEYAPVPPEDNNDVPPSGNLAAVGLGSSSAIKGGGAPGGNDGTTTTAPAPDAPLGALPTEAGQKASATNKRCVGNPPRQTEDPLAPPCVSYFSGDNFGATYQGVTANEVRLLIYLDPLNYINGTDGGTDNIAPSNTLFDLFVPPGEAPNPEGHEHLIVRGFRAWQTYFNDAFQTYGRAVHFYVYWSNGGTATAEGRRADAAQLHKELKPFAVVTDAGGGAEDAFLREMARRGVLNFGSFGLRSAQFFNEFPKLIWSYPPSIEQQAETYTSYLCKKVVNQPPVLANADIAAQANGKRKFGIINTTDTSQAGLIQLAKIVKEKVTACGGEIAATANFAACCFAQDNQDTSTAAQESMAEFKQKNVTTILWPGGIAGNYGKSAAALSYYPEWIVAGDGTMDGNNPIRLAQLGPSFDGHAIVVSPETFQPGLDEQRCAQTYRTVDKEMSRPNLGYICEYYRNLFQVFLGIQVSGPRLGPTGVDKGFHAIPSIASTDRQTPSCFYLANDYTCVKDAQAEIWDNSGDPPGDNRPGCWKAIEDGRRYLSGQFPDGNVNAQYRDFRALECNGFSVAVTVRQI